MNEREAGYLGWLYNREPSSAVVLELLYNTEREEERRPQFVYAAASGLSGRPFQLSHDRHVRTY